MARAGCSLWHHGSPQTGALLDPVVSAAAARGLRVVSCARPGYGGSTRLPGRDVAAAASDVAAVVEALSLARVAVMGASGGGPHALACAALVPQVTSVVCLAGIAPLFDGFFDGMQSPGGLRSALAGTEAREAFEEDFDEAQFVDADWAALRGTWAPLGRDAGQAFAAGVAGLVDDDVAFVAPWGFALASIGVPALFVQGGSDRVVPAAHARHQHAAVAGSELWLRPDDGHISVPGRGPGRDGLAPHPRLSGGSRSPQPAVVTT